MARLRSGPRWGRRSRSQADAARQDPRGPSVGVGRPASRKRCGCTGFGRSNGRGDGDRSERLGGRIGRSACDADRSEWGHVDALVGCPPLRTIRLQVLGPVVSKPRLRRLAPKLPRVRIGRGGPGLTHRRHDGVERLRGEIRLAETEVRQPEASVCIVLSTPPRDGPDARESASARRGAGSRSAWCRSWLGCSLPSSGHAPRDPRGGPDQPSGRSGPGQAAAPTANGEPA